MKLTNNTILITGGTSGLGLELGKALQKMNNKVILLGRDFSKLSPETMSLFETIQCDITKQEDLEKTALLVQNSHPNLNILINNAGVQFNYYFTEGVIPLQKISDEIAINASGQIILTQLLLPVLSQNENAAIINTTSGLGAFPKMDGLVYSASKATMRNFTMGLRLSLQKTSIKVMEFIPPVTQTPMTEGRNEAKMTPEKLVKIILPQLQKNRKILTTKQMRLFLWIAFLSPRLAHKILSK